MSTSPATDGRKAWRTLRPGPLAELAATMSAQDIADLFGIPLHTVRSRLTRSRLTAQRRPRVRDFPRCAVPLALTGAPCGAPLDPDDTCRWAHQHADQKSTR